MSASATDCDIAIVGGGPAGLSTALHLAAIDPGLARRCVVLEAKRHPRDKPCAGGVTSGALDYVRRLGLDPNELRRTPVSQVRVRLGPREVVVCRQPFCFDVVRRAEFDAALASLLGGRGPAFEQETRVLGVRAGEDTVEVTTDRGALCCRAVVGADGASSVVRASTWPDDRGDRVVGVQCLRPGTRSDPEEAIFDFTPMTEGIVGYAWDFPAVGSGRSVGVFSHGDPPAAARYLRSRLCDAEGGSADPIPVQAASVRAFRPSNPTSSARVLLVGDAVGIDPLLGEGISLALGYGEVAARALARASATEDWSFASYRREVLAHRVGRCLRKRALRHRVLALPGSHRVLEHVWPLVVEVGESAAFAPG